MEWQPIETAPTDGTNVIGRRPITDRMTGKPSFEIRKMWWGKTSHIPLYGWCFGTDPEDIDLWEPTEWKRFPNKE